MIKADLHCHSKFSDGSCDINEIIRFAAKENIDILALTDHDTVDGVEDIKKLANNYGIKIIPGAEITCKDYKRNRTIHMLCYYPNENVLNIGKNTLKLRNKSFVDCIENIKDICNISLEDVLYYKSYAPSIYPTHIMQTLSQMGYCKHRDKEARVKFMGKDSPYYKEYDMPNVYDVLHAVKKDGAVAILAHPGEYDSFEVLEELAEQNLIHGVECFHPRNTDEDTKKAIEICEKYNLLKSGGTDFHGENNAHPNKIGTFLCPEDTVLKIMRDCK